MSNRHKVTELINSRSVQTDQPPSGKWCVAGVEVGVGMCPVWLSGRSDPQLRVPSYCQEVVAPECGELLISYRLICKRSFRSYSTLRKV